MKTYTELLTLPTFQARLEYLALPHKVGEDTFGFDRYLNQVFYKSHEWLRIRDEVILRDNGCDLAAEDHPIFGRILIHHMNPIRQHDILERSDFLLNPEYLVCVSHDTHNQIHYGIRQEPPIVTNREQGDTKLW